MLCLRQYFKVYFELMSFVCKLCYGSDFILKTDAAFTMIVNVCVSNQKYFVSSSEKVAYGYIKFADGCLLLKN